MPGGRCVHPHALTEDGHQRRRHAALRHGDGEGHDGCAGRRRHRSLLGHGRPSTRAAPRPRTRADRPRSATRARRCPGADAIEAYADNDNDNTQDPGEPFDTASKIWTVPTSTPMCEAKITQGGWIIADNGDRGSFGGNAKADQNGNPSGQENYQDHGPAQPMHVKSTQVTAITCNDGAHAGVDLRRSDDRRHRLARVPDRRPGPGRARKGSRHVPDPARHRLRLR